MRDANIHYRMTKEDGKSHYILSRFENTSGESCKEKNYHLSFFLFFLFFFLLSLDWLFSFLSLMKSIAFFSLFFFINPRSQLSHINCQPKSPPSYHQLLILSHSFLVAFIAKLRRLHVAW